MKIGYKLYFMSEKLRKMQLIYPIFFPISSYNNNNNNNNNNNQLYLTRVTPDSTSTE